MRTRENFLAEFNTSELCLALKRCSTSLAAPEGVEGYSSRIVTHLTTTERVTVFFCLWDSGEDGGLEEMEANPNPSFSGSLAVLSSKVRIYGFTISATLFPFQVTSLPGG